MLRERMETRKQIVLGTKPDNGQFAGRRVHLIGIGGCGMRALATMLADCGAVISGSDVAPGAVVERFTRRGMKIQVGQRAENIPDDCELVVHTAAIHPQNPELVAARQRGLTVMKYAQMLGLMMANRIGVAVSGTHGKSTTTAMVASVLHMAGADPSYVVGAIVEQLGGPSGVGLGKHFVAEACEYDRSFLNLRPHMASSRARRPGRDRSGGLAAERPREPLPYPPVTIVR
jgi:UDP-N-acetylmuramate--alanine ligase